VERKKAEYRHGPPVQRPFMTIHLPSPVRNASSTPPVKGFVVSVCVSRRYAFPLPGSESVTSTKRPSSLMLVRVST
jgi:hypothetical protein